MLKESYNFAEDFLLGIFLFCIVVWEPHWLLCCNEEGLSIWINWCYYMFQKHFMAWFIKIEIWHVTKEKVFGLDCYNAKLRIALVKIMSVMKTVFKLLWQVMKMGAISKNDIKAAIIFLPPFACLLIIFPILKLCCCLFLFFLSRCNSA